MEISSSLVTCSNPGCDQPGTNRCSACKTNPYCGPICQTANWIHHKEECPGHLRKIGMSNLVKAREFHRERNFPQSFRHADISATKLQKLKDRPIEIIDEALFIKYNSLNFMGKHKEALESAKERYCLYLTKHTHPPAIIASFAVIESCIHNKEYFDAALYARTLWETITMSCDSHIPDNLREQFTARGAKELARALHALAQHGGMPVEEKQQTGKEAIMLARRALEIDTQVNGAESLQVGNDMAALAQVLSFFSEMDGDETIRLYDQSTAIYAKVEGNYSKNVATNEYNVGSLYYRRSKKAADAHDLDLFVFSLEMALPHYREAVRIYRAINHEDDANDATQYVVRVEELLKLTAPASALSASSTSELAKSVLATSELATSATETPSASATVTKGAMEK